MIWLIRNISKLIYQIYLQFLRKSSSRGTRTFHEIFCENPRIIFVLFYDVQKENMFTINLEDGREAPYKASIINSGIFLTPESEALRMSYVK